MLQFVTTLQSNLCWRPPLNNGHLSHLSTTARLSPARLILIEKPLQSYHIGAIQIIRDTFSALFRPPPPPFWHLLSTFTSETANKNCRVTFLLTPPPKVSRIIWMAPYVQRPLLGGPKGGRCRQVWLYLVIFYNLLIINSILSISLPCTNVLDYIASLVTWLLELDMHNVYLC